MSDNGYVDQNLLVAIVDHVNKHARKYVPQEKLVVFMLDGHSSRKGVE